MSCAPNTVLASTYTYGYTNAGRTNTISDGNGDNKALSYNTYGRAATYSIPAGSYSGISYDAEGNLTQFSGYGGESVSLGYNNRGQNVNETFSPNPVSSGVENWPGFVFPSADSSVVQDPAEQLDLRNGTPRSIYSQSYGYDSTGELTSISAFGNVGPQSYSYDGAGRLLSGSGDQEGPPAYCSPSSRQTQGYRAMGGVTSSKYGADGELISESFTGNPPGGGTHTRNFHWANGELTMSATDGTIDALYIGSDGYVPTKGYATSYDRDLSGYVTAEHNSTGSSAWTAPNMYGEPCAGNGSVAASSGYQAYPETAVGSESIVRRGMIDDGYNRLDGRGRGVVPNSGGALGSNTRSKLDATVTCPPGYGPNQFGGCDRIIGTTTNWCGQFCAIIYVTEAANGLPVGWSYNPDWRKPYPGTHKGPGNPAYVNLPSNAQNCNSMGHQFNAPPGFNLQNIAAEGFNNTYDGSAAVAFEGQFGVNDIQREGFPDNFTFYAGYTEAGNMGVGAYLFGFGLPEIGADMISNHYAAKNSTNQNDPARIAATNLGFEIAALDAPVQCTK